MKSTTTTGGDGATAAVSREKSVEITVCGVVAAIAISNDGKTVVSGSEDKSVCLWSAETGEQMRVLNGHTKSVFSVAISRDGKTVVSGSEDRSVRVWSAKTGEQLRVLRGHSVGIFSVAISDDGKTIVSGSNDRTVRVWNAKTGEQLRVLRGHSVLTNSVAISNDGKTAVLTDPCGKKVKLFSTETGALLDVFHGHTDCVFSLAISNDGKTVVSGSADRSVRLWSAKTGEQVRVLRGHLDRVHSVAISYDGKTVVSGSWDNTVRLWSAETGEQLRLLKTGFDYNGVKHVATFADGTWIVAGLKNDKICVQSGVFEIIAGDKADCAPTAQITSAELTPTLGQLVDAHHWTDMRNRETASDSWKQTHAAFLSDVAEFFGRFASVCTLQLLVVHDTDAANELALLPMRNETDVAVVEYANDTDWQNFVAFLVEKHYCVEPSVTCAQKRIISLPALSLSIKQRR